jgi:predicted transposase YdaD
MERQSKDKRSMAKPIPKRYDVTFKDLVQSRPRDVLTLAGVTDVIDVVYEDTDLSALIAVADKILRVRSAYGEYLVHFEFQSGPDVDLLDRMFWYNAALYFRHRCPVLTVLVLLTPAADGPKLNGVFRIVTPPIFESNIFGYKIVRLWETPVEVILNGPIGILPLAPLCKDSEDIKTIVATTDRRFRKELQPSEEAKYWLAVCTLMGLYYDSETVFQLLPKGKAMKESSTYQAILNEGRQEGRQEGRAEGRQEGRTEEALRLLLRLGNNAIGQPAAGIRERLETVHNVEAIESMIERLHHVSSWEELIARPAASARKSRKKKT